MNPSHPLAFAALLAGLAAGPAAALDQDGAVRLAMDAAYGPRSGNAASWRKVHEGVRYVVRPAAVRKVSTPYGERIYIFASGSVPKNVDAGHVTPGIVGAHVVEERGGHVAIVASTASIVAGGYGSAPDKAELHQFGPDHYYGWIYEDGYSGQGYTQSRRIVLLPRGKAFAPLASVLAAMDSSGAKPCDDPATRAECQDLKFDFAIDTTAAGVKVWPLVITKSGIDSGRRVAPAVTRIAFDEKAWRYAVPRALSEGY